MRYLTEKELSGIITEALLLFQTSGHDSTRDFATKLASSMLIFLDVVVKGEQHAEVPTSTNPQVADTGRRLARRIRVKTAGAVGENKVPVKKVKDA